MLTIEERAKEQYIKMRKAEVEAGVKNEEDILSWDDCTEDYKKEYIKWYEEFENSMTPFLNDLKNFLHKEDEK